MRRRHTAEAGFALVLLLSGHLMAQERDVKVKGRVLDVDGRPVAGARVGSMWHASLGNKQDAFVAAVADDDGRFTAKVNFYGRDGGTHGDRCRPHDGRHRGRSRRRRQARSRDPARPAHARSWQVRVQGPGPGHPLDKRLYQLCFPARSGCFRTRRRPRVFAAFAPGRIRHERLRQRRRGHPQAAHDPRLPTGISTWARSICRPRLSPATWARSSRTGRSPTPVASRRT